MSEKDTLVARTIEKDINALVEDLNIVIEAHNVLVDENKQIKEVIEEVREKVVELKKRFKQEEHQGTAYDDDLEYEELLQILDKGVKND